MDSLVSRLEESGQLDNTYIIYTSDNGFHIGQHRLPPGKTCGFEEDIRVPLFIRGPGVPEGYVQDSVTTHIDLAPTIFNLAGIPPRADFDGTAIPVTPDFGGTRHEHVTVEFWGRAVMEGIHSQIGRFPVSRYGFSHCLRLLTVTPYRSRWIDYGSEQHIQVRPPSGRRLQPVLLCLVQ